MQQAPHYDDVVAEVRGFLAARVRACALPASRASALCVDPGFGFGKTLAHNLQLLRRLRGARSARVAAAGGLVAQVAWSGTLTGRGAAASALPAASRWR